MVIEQRLVEAVQQLSLSYVLQDLECGRCHGVSVTLCVHVCMCACVFIKNFAVYLPMFIPWQVKDTNVRDYCNCAGEFCKTSSSEKLLDQLIMFDSIAKYA